VRQGEIWVRQGETIIFEGETGFATKTTESLNISTVSNVIVVPNDQSSKQPKTVIPISETQPKIPTLIPNPPLPPPAPILKPKSKLGFYINLAEMPNYSIQTQNKNHHNQ
jgi:outer membrane biosynthesis protein TonB